MLGEAALALTAVEAAVRWLPCRWLARGLGPPVVETAAAQGGAEAERARGIGWALRTAARHLPWTCRCLAQALAGRWMLKRRGISSTVHLGVDRGRDRWLDAHAWLRSGEVILTGGAGRQRFKAIAAFGEPPAKENAGPRR